MVSEVSIRGERFMVPGPGAILVASKSEPGKWHKTTTSSCDCKSAKYRGGKCRHVAALQQIAAEAIERTEQAERAGRIAAANREIWGQA